jgi:hypothetical protein
VSSAIVTTLQDFFGTDRERFDALSDASKTTRTFTRFSQAIGEVIDARVYSGIHFRTADVQGAQLRRRVARSVLGREAPVQGLHALVGEAHELPRGR